MSKEKTANIYVGNQRIQIQKKHGFFSYFKTYILMCLVIILILGVLVTGFIYNYQSMLEFLGRFTPVIIISIFTVKVMAINVKWLKNHLYIPLTHEELLNNQIESCWEYEKVLYQMFHYKPLKRAICDIKNTAKEELHKDIDEFAMACCYQKSRFEQVFIIICIVFFMFVFIYSVLNPAHDISNDDGVFLQWILILTYFLIFVINWRGDI